MTTLRKTLFSVRAGGTSSSSADRGKEINPQAATSLADEDFSGKGVDLNVKYFGKCVVAEPRGEKMAHSAMKDLKQQLQAASGHKQRVIVNLSMFGVQLFDERRQRELAKHAVRAVSFMTVDPEDGKIFSYIAAEGPDEQTPKRVFRLYCFKSEKQTALITNSLMRIFKLAHEEKKRQGSITGGDGKPLARRGTTKNSPLPPLPTTGEVPHTEDSQYATLSSTVTPTPAKVQNRASLALIDFNQASTNAAGPPEDTAGGDYAAVNPGSKASFSMSQFGLQLGKVEDVTALPAPIGAPFADVAADPFGDPNATPVKPFQARESTILAFDPVGTGGNQAGADAAPQGFDSDFGAFGDRFADDASHRESGVYAVPRFPAIRAVLSDDDVGS